jgi:hypothetical protein
MLSLRSEIVRMDAEEYHRDPAPPSLSASIAHVLVKQSPLHAYARHPRLGGVMPVPTLAMDKGALMHRLLLGVGKELRVIDAPDFRKSTAKDERDAAYAAGAVPVLALDHDEANHTARELRKRFDDLGIHLTGESELAAFWGEMTYDGDAVQCRGMFDHLALPRVYDLKGIWSAHPDVCRKHVDDYGYALQRAAYVSALEKLRPEYAGRIDFVFVFYETEPPYAVVPRRLSGEFRQLGERRWKRAVDTWARCLKTGVWPGYDDRIRDLEPAPWALAKDMDNEVAAATATWSDDL